jgi:hypothetical protein
MELKCCPFCGGEAMDVGDDTVSCVDPGCAGFKVFAPRSLWNRRASDEAVERHAPAGSVKRAREALTKLLRWAEEPSVSLDAAQEFEDALKEGHEALAALKEVAE